LQPADLFSVEDPFEIGRFFVKLGNLLHFFGDPLEQLKLLNLCFFRLIFPVKKRVN
jgi:hypothetical protein